MRIDINFVCTNRVVCEHPVLSAQRSFGNLPNVLVICQVNAVLITPQQQQLFGRFDLLLRVVLKIGIPLVWLVKFANILHLLANIVVELAVLFYQVTPIANLNADGCLVKFNEW